MMKAMGGRCLLADPALEIAAKTGGVQSTRVFCDGRGSTETERAVEWKRLTEALLTKQRDLATCVPESKVYRSLEPASSAYCHDFEQVVMSASERVGITCVNSPLNHM
jgi:class 3 adenylate cyclase